MAKKELRKLNRTELLELLIAQTERADRLTEELHEAKEQIRNREDLIRQAGELAEAASRLIEMMDTDSVKASPVLQPKPAAATPAELLQLKPKPVTKPQPQTAAGPAAGSGHTLSQLIREAFEQQDARPAAVKQTVRKNASQINRQMPKGKVNETNGLDLSAIMAITAGIGKGKI